MSHTKTDPRSGDAWGYIRVSTLKQANSGLSMEEQKAAIETYCQHMGLKLAGIFEDPATSGGTSLVMRKGGSKLQVALKPGDTIICKNFARAFRNTIDACTQAKRWYEIDKCFLVLLDMGGQPVDYSTPMGRFIFTIMAATMEYEKEARREQTRDALALAKEKGLLHRSRCPLGSRWLINGHYITRLVRCEETWKTMELFHSLYYEKGMNIEQIYRFAVRLQRTTTVRKRRGTMPDGKHTYFIVTKKTTWGVQAIRKAIDMVQQKIEGGDEVCPVVAS